MTSRADFVKACRESEEACPCRTSLWACDYCNENNAMCAGPRLCQHPMHAAHRAMAVAFATAWHDAEQLEKVAGGEIACFEAGCADADAAKLLRDCGLEKETP